MNEERRFIIVIVAIIAAMIFGIGVAGAVRDVMVEQVKCAHLKADE